MWTVKNPHLIKQKNRNPATRPFFNFCNQFNEEALNIAPLDIAACRPRKDQLNNSLMPPFHFLIVPVSGTERKSGLLMIWLTVGIAIVVRASVPCGPVARRLGQVLRFPDEITRGCGKRV